VRRHDHGRGSDLLLCGSCDLPVPRDESGAWDLAARPPSCARRRGALRVAQAAFGDTPVPDALDIAILDRALPAGELSALRASRTVLVA
jgi:hypothetical protein